MMTSHLGNNISFREGDIIIDPERIPVHGSFIVAFIAVRQRGHFQIIRYLKPLNPQYPLMEWSPLYA
jgi:hypothetical protein